MSSTPDLTVIVINLGRGSRLAACLESIAGQRHVAAQIVIVDGSGTDATRAALAEYGDRVTVVTAPPAASHFAAANLGLASARGEWVLFLQPEDRVVGDMVLSECITWTRKTEAGVISGEVAYDDGRVIKLRSHPNALAKDFVPPAGTLYRRSLFEENGGFDETLPELAAYEFNLRLWKGRVRFKPIPIRVVASARRHTFSWAAAREEMRARHRYFSRGRCLGADLGSIVRGLLRR
ncbi:MAG TPA: glycosyltransferase [Opitutaceae bacterium]